MMGRTLLLGLMVLAVACSSAAAQDQPADQYFHTAAQQYIGEHHQQALQTIQAGLEAYPSDPKLQALLRALQQQRDQRRGGSDNQSGQQQQQQNRPSSNASPGSNEQEGSPQGQSTSENQPEDPQGAQPSKADPSQNSPQNDEKRPGAPQTASGSLQDATRRLTKAQAERILRALENQEKQLLRQIQRHGEAERRVKKDW